MSSQEDHAPFSDSPTRSWILELPAELLHTIFSYLDIRDVLAARRTCSILESVGIDHFGNEVPLVYHREKFRALKHIARHPALAKRMRSLFYVVDRFHELSFEEWDERRVNHEPLYLRKFLDEVSDTHDPEIVSQVMSNNREARVAKLAAVPKEDLQDGYHAFLAICHVQVKIKDTGYDYGCLYSFFRGCCKIREVTIVSQVHCDRRIGARYTAFDRASILPDQDVTWSDAGADQVCALAHAVERSGLKLDSLTIAGISHAIFDRSIDRGNATSHALRALVRPLRRFRLLIQAWPPEAFRGSQELPESESVDADTLLAVRLESVSVFEEGHARKVLAEARELRVLKLELPQWNPNGGFAKYVRLDRALRDIHFPHLYEIACSQCAIKGDWLVDFILRHKATLRLSLIHI